MREVVSRTENHSVAVTRQSGHAESSNGHLQVSRSRRLAAPALFGPMGPGAVVTARRVLRLLRACPRESLRGASACASKQVNASPLIS